MDSRNAVNHVNVSNLTFLSLIFVLLFMIMKCIARGSSPAIPPGPFPWPVIGNFLQVRENPHIKLSRMARTYGPIMSLRVGAQLVVVGSSVKAAMEILKTHDRVLSGRHLSYTQPASCPKLNQYWIGFARECNDQWKHLRSICRAGLFSVKAIESQVEIRERNVVNMVKFLHEREGQLVNMSEVIHNLVFNTMYNILLSRDVVGFGPDGGGAGPELKELTGQFLNLLAATNVADLFPILHGLDIQGIQKKVRKITEKMFVMWQDIVRERRDQRRKGFRAQEDFLDSLLEIGLSDNHINHLLLELLLAGTDTTTLTIIWALADLIKNNNARSKLRDELTVRIGDKTIQESEIMDLPYLQACIRESIRLHPPVPFLLPRRATQSSKVMDCIIPKGSRVIINTWAMARDPSVWDDPSSFIPERFLDSSMDFKGNDFEYVPFGSGRRMCPGWPMAARVVPYVVASLIHSFNWFLPGYNDPSELNMDEIYLLALRKKQPLQLIPIVCKKMA
ncbi:UNVERIFIED_CONTAM: putative (S)-N-methylcoclaurine 3'-hydroxylase isozyme 2 [Sesamum radiatum]|uniref:(S)-N-methylcoclaurine 3'-hydroxylase isozyme 2 n=1 Tax=Sesamum radiatum TaxID=300843 RepID=A0AAW2TEC6_SESRA